MKIRFYAFLTHLMISTLVAIIAIYIVFFVWYPMPLDQAMGVADIYKILLAVDISIGPVLTFVVFVPKKWGLKMDLILIALAQIIALVYGMFTVFQGRPVFVVFNQDRFDLVRPIDIDTASAKKALQDHNSQAIVSWFGPSWVAAVTPSNPKREQEILFSAALGGADWPQLPELYVALEQVKGQMLKKARSLSELLKFNSTGEDAQDLIKIQGNQVKWLPLRGKDKDLVVLINTSSAKVIKVVDIDPWPDN